MEKRYLYYIVDCSLWPILSIVAVFFSTSGFVLYIHRVENSFLVFILGLIMLVSVFYVWWRDVVRESTYQGNHTLIVQRGLKLGFILFLCTEVMFFSGFFFNIYIDLVIFINILIFLIFLYKFYKIKMIEKKFIFFWLGIIVFFYFSYFICLYNQYLYNNSNIFSILKIILSFVLFIILKNNFFGLKDRILSIKKFLLKFKVCMFIIGFILVFLQFFNIFENNNVSYAMDNKIDKFDNDGFDGDDFNDSIINKISNNDFNWKDFLTPKNSGIIGISIIMIVGICFWGYYSLDEYKMDKEELIALMNSHNLDYANSVHRLLVDKIYLMLYSQSWRDYNFWSLMTKSCLIAQYFLEHSEFFRTEFGISIDNLREEYIPFIVGYVRKKNGWY